MVRISEALIRKRAEHNEGEISTLEELSLHQLELERIEYLDRWCKDLKILYLQSNLIPKIENVGRLKKLDYLNLALNNIERIENLEGCEDLRKLDMTVNFVGEISSVASLRANDKLRELYLTGNPCAQFTHYREYVIATLPHLTSLDGQEVEKSERIRALQMYETVKPLIAEQEAAYMLKRAEEKKAAEEERKKKSKAANSSTAEASLEGSEEVSGQVEKEKTVEDEDKAFWAEQVPFTPESRVDVHQHMQKVRERDAPKEKVEAKPKRLFKEDGTPLNVNEAKFDFTLTESDDGANLLLNVELWKHLETNYIDCDVQPTYVRLTYTKEKWQPKIFQLVLPDEVKTDSTSAQRSQTTGHLLLTLPKLVPGRPTFLTPKPAAIPVGKTEDKGKLPGNPTKQSDSNGQPKASVAASKPSVLARPEENSEDFVDDPDVPPLI